MRPNLLICINTLYPPTKNNFVVTPVGHIFAIYPPPQSGQAARPISNPPAIHYDRDGKSASFWALNGSASLHNKSLVITVVNPSASDARETQLVLHSAKIKSATATALTHSDIHAHNTFTHKPTVIPQTKT